MSDLTWWRKQSHVSKRVFQQQWDEVKWKIHVLAVQHTTVTNLVTIHYTVLEMAVRIARSNGEVRSFGNFLHSSSLALTAEPDSRQLQRAVKCVVIWFHIRCVWTGNKLPDTTKIQVKLVAMATAVRQRKSEISGYDIVAICSLRMLLIHIPILSTYYVDLTCNRKRSQVVLTRTVGLHYPPQVFCCLTT